MTDENATTPAAPAAPAAEAPPAAAAPSAPESAQTPPAGDELSEWKGHARDWEKRAKANAEAAKERDTLAARLAEYETNQQTVAEQLATAKADAEKALTEATRYRVAAAKGIPAELLPEAGDEESLGAFADRLIEFRGAQSNSVPGVGATPPKPPSRSEQIRQAEAAGNAADSLALKTGLLAELAQQAK